MTQWLLGLGFGFSVVFAVGQVLWHIYVEKNRHQKYLTYRRDSGDDHTCQPLQNAIRNTSTTIRRRSPSISSNRSDIKYTATLETDSKLDTVDRVLTNAQANYTDLLNIFDVLNDMIIECPDKPEVLLRLGEVCSRLGEKSTVLSDRKRYIERGITACQRALILKPKWWLAINLLNKLFKAQVDTVEQIQDSQPGTFAPTVVAAGSSDTDSNGSDEFFDSLTMESFEEIMAKVEAQFINDSNDSEVGDTLEFLKELDRNDYPNNPEVLWRLGKACVYVCEKTNPSNGTKLKHIDDGIKACKRAVELNKQLANAHKWLAVLYVLRAEFRTYYPDVVLFKKHLDVALQLTNNDRYLYYLLGRYLYSMADLSFLERRGVEMLYENIPAPSYRDALEKLLIADRMCDKPFKANSLMIGKCCIALKAYRNAFQWLLRAKAVPPGSYTEIPERSTDITEIERLLCEYKSYK